MKRKTLLALAGASALLVLLAGTRLHHGEWSFSGGSDATGAGKLSNRGAADARRRIPPDHEGRMQLAKEWYEKLTAARPALQIHYREVPDEKNGLLQLLKASENLDSGVAEQIVQDPEGSYNIRVEPPELAAMLSGNAPWDPQLAAKWLAGHGEMLARMEEIGLMPDQSCRGADWNTLALKARDLSYLGDMLGVKARLAAESGDSDSAFRTLEALRGLSQHLSRCEAPTMMAIAVAEQMNDRLVKASGWLAGEATSREEVEHWQGLLPTAGLPDTAAVLRGEWNVSAARFFLPSLMGEETDGSEPVIEDAHPEVSAEAWADATASQIGEAQETAPRELLTRSQNGTAAAATTNLPVDIDPASRERIGKTISGGNMLVTGMILTRGRQAMEQAARAASLGKEPGPELITGEPYRIDRKTGTVQMPDSEGVRDVEPVKIPVIREAAASPAE